MRNKQAYKTQTYRQYKGAEKGRGRDLGAKKIVTPLRILISFDLKLMLMRDLLANRLVLTFAWSSKLGTCEASRSFYSNSNRTSLFEFDSKVTCRFENFESATHAVCRHTTNCAHSLFNKNINLCAVSS